MDYLLNLGVIFEKAYKQTTVLNLIINGLPSKLNTSTKADILSEF